MLSPTTRRILLFAIALMALPQAAAALPSYTLDIVAGDAQNNFNVPKFVLANDSTAGEAIVGFTFSIGDTGHYFDFVLGALSSPAATPANLATEVATGAALVAGDRDNDRAGVVELEWAFSSFGAGEQLVFEVDVDPLGAQSGGSQKDDASIVFVDNGAAPNSRLGLVFDDGSTIDLVLPDTNGGPLSFTGGTVSIDNSVPEPGTLVLMGLGAVGLVIAGRRQP